VRLSVELLARLGRLAQSEGVELLAAEVGGTARKPVVRLVLDRDPGGVTLADCEAISRQASVLLDAYDPFPGAFTLEVSSPGVERKLYNEGDFHRFEGRTVRVRMRPGWPAPRVVEGVLEGRREGEIRVRDRAGATQRLPEREVLDTRLAPEIEQGAATRKQRGRKEEGRR
jgi:ribosome maturation factor RimP